MNAVSLQRSAALSFVVHLALLGLFLVAARQSNHFVMPSAYVVNLVNPDALMVGPGTGTGTQGPTRAEHAVEQTKLERGTGGTISSHQEAPARLPKEEEKRASEQIAAIRAKRAMERRVALRDIVSVTKGKDDSKVGVPGGTREGTPGGGMRAAGRPSLTDDYIARVGEEIRQHWIFPDTGTKGVEAIVSIRIQKNGSVQVLGMEKSSGNPLFDRSALRAITKATPVAPPPYEMEIGVRFSL